MKPPAYRLSVPDASITGMTRPRLLDLFCGSGGAGVGYHRAGFDVVGIDNVPQPKYPFTFHRADALVYLAGHGHEYDAIHASCPCQHYSPATAWRGDRDDHPDLVDATRAALIRVGKPWVIENVPNAPLRRDLVLCGSQLGLKVKRHRVFESSITLAPTGVPCRHDGLLPFMHKNERAFADAMECYWMSNLQARDAIPPRFTEFIGRQLLVAMAERAA